MCNQPIKYHSKTNTYIIQKKSYFEKDMFFDGNVITGINTYFWKNLKVNGTLKLGIGSSIKENLTAKSAIIGSKSKIKCIEVDDNLTLLNGAKIKFATCNGNTIIHSNCCIDLIKTKGILEIIGAAYIKEMRQCSKVIVRS